MTSLRAAIYCRISSDKEGFGLGVARQEEDCRAVCERLGWEAAEVFRDNDRSAYDPKRVDRRIEYRRLLDEVRSARVQAVVAWHPDRVFGHPRELEDLIDLVEATGTQIATVQTGSYDLSTPSGRLVARQLGAASRFEREMKAERQRREARQRAEHGKPNGGMRQFGYVDGQRTAICVDEGDVIRTAVTKLLAGASKAEVIRYMNEHSTTTTGKKWKATNGMAVLNSAAIAGIRELHARDPKRREVVARGCWPAIINEDTHQRVRTVIEARRGTGNRRAAVRAYLLTGIAECGLCGRTLVAQPRPTYRSYRCDQARGCGRIRVQADPLEEYVRDVVFAHVMDPEQVKRRSDEAASLDSAEREVRGALTHLDVRQQNLSDLAVDGVLPTVEVRRKQRELDEERTALERRLVRLTNALAALPAGTHEDEVRERWDSLTLGEQRQVVRSITAKITVKPAVPGRNRFDPGRVSIAPVFGPLLDAASRGVAELAEVDRWVDVE